MSDTVALSPTIRAKLDEWLLRYPSNQKRSAVFEALRLVQLENGGWLSVSLMDAVAAYLSLPNMSVYEVATFYSLFHLSPVGKHVIDVCTNISCMLNGSEEIVAHLKKQLNIGFNETTADGKFTLREVECLGACVAPPVCQIGNQYYESLTPEKINQLLGELKHGE